MSLSIQQQREAILARLQKAEISVGDASKELALLDAKPAGKMTCKKSEKGGLSVYGLGRWPVTLYREQWERLFGFEGEIRAFIAANTWEAKEASKASKYPATAAAKTAPETAAPAENPVIVEYADEGVAVGPFRNVILAGKWERGIGLSGGHFVQRNNATDTHWAALLETAIPDTDTAAIEAAFVAK